MAYYFVLHMSQCHAGDPARCPICRAGDPAGRPAGHPASGAVLWVPEAHNQCLLNKVQEESKGQGGM